MRAPLDTSPVPSRRCAHMFGSPACGYVQPEKPRNRVGLGFDHCGGSFGECVERGDDEAMRGVAPEREADRRPQRFGWTRTTNSPT